MGRKDIDAYGDEVYKGRSVPTILKDYPEETYVLEFWRDRRKRITFSGTFYIPKSASKAHRYKKVGRDDVLIFVQDAGHIKLLDGTKIHIDGQTKRRFEKSFKAMSEKEVEGIIEYGSDLYEFVTKHLR